MKEYGSSVQKLVDKIVEIEDRPKRTKYAHILVELMRQIHPNMSDNQDYYQRLWDDLYIMSEFALDVDSPFPPPSPDSIGKRPNKVEYNTHNLRFRHYGHNLELMVEKACILADPEERKAFVSYLVKMMKSFYASWNKDNTEDAVVLDQLFIMSKGQLKPEIDAYRRGEIVESIPKDRYNASYVPNVSRMPRDNNGGIGVGGHRDRENRNFDGRGGNNDRNRNKNNNGGGNRNGNSNKNDSRNGNSNDRNRNRNNNNGNSNNRRRK